MISLFKKYKITKEPYEYNTDVPFEIAFKALKEGYTIKHSNQTNCFLVMINDRIYEVLDRDGDNTFEIKEFSVFDMLIDRWQVLEPHTFVRRKVK